MEEQKNENRLYTINEIMELVSVTRPTIHEWIRTGKIKAVRIGREYRIRHDQYLDFLQNNAVENPDKK